MQVVMLLYPRLTQLDLTGPFEVCARFEELNVHRRAAAALQIA